MAKRKPYLFDVGDMVDVHSLEYFAHVEKVRKSLLNQLKSNNSDTSHCIGLIDDYVRFFDIKTKLQNDIIERGVSVEYHNSEFQFGVKKNDSIGELIKTNGQMLKILDALGLNVPKNESSSGGDNRL